MDDLERRIRAANPHPIDRDAPLSERAERELAALLVTPRETQESRSRRLPASRRLTIAATTIAATLLVVLTVGIANLLVVRPAAASSPPLLIPTPIAESTDAVLGRLTTMARANPTTAPSAVIAAETWSAELTPGADEVTFVQPREIVRTRNDDLSGSVVTRAGEVRWGVVPDGQAPVQPGTVLEENDFGTGEYPMLFPAPPPDDADELQGYLEQTVGITQASTTGDIFRATVDLRNEWSLDGGQTAALLELIATRDDVIVLGTVTDRLGRTGIALATDTRFDGAFRDILIFDPETATLLAAEDVYLGGIDDIQLEAPAVLNYTAWKDTP